MFDHVTVRAADLEASDRFYATVLATLGAEMSRNDMGPEWGDFALAAAGPDKPVTRRLHVGFFAGSRERVDAFWQAGVDAGYADDGAPGPRPRYADDYYGAFLLDPDGNSVEAMHMTGDDRRPAQVDHLWIRVADVETAREFYAAIAPAIGLVEASAEPGRAQFRGVGHSFSLVEGEPTENVHLAFGVPDHDAVEGFHASAVGAGARDDGAPGERPQYHPGYYAAYVLDPDGNSVEAVHHGPR